MLEQARVGAAVNFRDAYLSCKRPDCLRWHAPSPHTRDRRHAWIIPSLNMPLLDEPQQLALAHHGVIQVEPSKFVLPRTFRLLLRLQTMLENPVVNLAIVLELKRAERMRNAFDRVFERVREVVHRIDAPVVARAVMMRVFDAV